MIIGIKGNYTDAFFDSMRLYSDAGASLVLIYYDVGKDQTKIRLREPDFSAYESNLDLN